MINSYDFGHEITYVDDEWVYADNLKPTSECRRKCLKCGGVETEEGQDPCIVNLLCVTSACCGHGITSEAFAMFDDGGSIRGKEAEKYFNKNKEE